MKNAIILLVLFITFAISPINAQTNILPEKEKAIKELYSLVAQNNNAEELAKLMSAQFSNMYEEIIKGLLNERKDLTTTEKLAFEKNLISEMRKFTLKIQDKLMQKIDYNKMTEEITIIVYDKYFSLEEINDLVVFYKTQTGKKSLRIMQPLMLESMQLTQERITPKLLAVMEEMREEQKKMVAKLIDELSPKKTRTNH